MKFLKNQKQVKYFKWYTNILSVKIKNSHTCKFEQTPETSNKSHKAHTEQINKIYNK